MKYPYILLLLLISLLISSYSSAQGSLATLDAKNGFKGYTFGSNLEKYKDLSHSPRMSKYDESFSKKYDYYVSKLDCYSTHKPGANIGDLEISTPLFFFFKNKLTRIDFFTSNPDGKELIKLYKSLYGNPKTVYGKTSFGSKTVTYSWSGIKVNLTIIYCADPYPHDSTISSWYRVVYLSKSIFDEIQNNELNIKKQSNKARANDL